MNYQESSETRCIYYYYYYLQMLGTVFTIIYIYMYCYGATTNPVGYGLLIHQVSRSHTTTHRSR